MLNKFKSLITISDERSTSMNLKEIEDRLAKATPGPWSLNSIGAKNYLMWFGGDWPKEEDDANYAFIANARKDIEDLIRHVRSLEYQNEILTIQLESLQGCQKYP